MEDKVDLEQLGLMRNTILISARRFHLRPIGKEERPDSKDLEVLVETQL